MIIEELRCVANDAGSKKRTNLLLWKMMEILYETLRRKLQRLHDIGHAPLFFNEELFLPRSTFHFRSIKVL